MTSLRLKRLTELAAGGQSVGVGGRTPGVGEMGSGL
jgi:hypothetical protein